jgi:hypothetical protein
MNTLTGTPQPAGISAFDQMRRSRAGFINFRSIMAKWLIYKVYKRCKECRRGTDGCLFLALPIVIEV